MKTNVILTAILMSGFIFTSCTKEDQHVTPSSHITTVSKPVSGFSKLEVTDPFHVYVTFSDAEEMVRIEANENLQQYIRIKEQNDLLQIGLDDNLTIRRGDAVLNIYITARQVNEYTASGAASIVLQNQLVDQSTEVYLSGASRFTGSLQVDDFSSTIIGASNLDINGTASHFSVEASGACIMNDFGFRVQDLTADLDGASTISMTVTQQLNVKARGSSMVYYKGDGIIAHQDLSDISRIVRLD